MNYRSIADINKDIKKNLFKIPKDVSLVVGIPRSGLMAANLIALYLNLPLSDISSFLKGETLHSGFRGRKYEGDAFKGKILIVDDSLCTGNSLKEVKEKLKNAFPSNGPEIIFCCVYVSPNNIDMTDIALVSLDMPRVFEWNIFHHTVIKRACINLEGVISVNDKKIDISNNEELLNYLNESKPYFLPKVKIATLVSELPEKYRDHIVQWLAQNKVEYEELVMLDLHPRKDNKNIHDRAERKAKEYAAKKNNKLYIESDKDDALKIFEITRKPVYCLENNEMYHQDSYSDLVLKAKRKSFRIIRRFKKYFYN